MDVTDELSEQPSHSSSGYGSASWDLDSTAENLSSQALMDDISTSQGLLEDLGISILDEDSMDVANSELMSNIHIDAITNSPNVTSDQLVAPGVSANIHSTGG